MEISIYGDKAPFASIKYDVDGDDSFGQFTL